ncbi:MAG: type I restriction enzyme HsdR N-terminal domain-containing protein [Desulfobacteraceae bacterium]|nr:type I restriction enzyme HsdR N-terminal domain-containing protein [Desulfobacteraceae bacterium]
MGTHHLILGETTDFITGKTITDTHDERARQKIARFLVEKKGYKKSEIYTHLKLPVEIDGKTGEVRVDFLVKPEGRPFMLVLFRPGSLVSRRRSALAAARLMENFIIPYAAVTNAEDAELLETRSGKVAGTGLDSFFSRKEALAALDEIKPGQPPDSDRREKEKRILFAMEVLSQKECDDYTCRHL